MMKRYRIFCESYENMECPIGEWVKYEDMLLHQRPLPRIEETLLKENTRLKELNREMLEVIRLFLNASRSTDRVAYVGIMVHSAVIDRASNVLTKAGGEG